MRAALTGGGTVTFACDGTIKLKATLIITNNTVLDASGHSITLDSAKPYTYQILRVSHARLSLRNVTVTGGGAYEDYWYGTGAGLLNDGGVCDIWNCSFHDNLATTNGIGTGAAICNYAGTLIVNNSTFWNNRSVVLARYDVVRGGGAIRNWYLGEFFATNCTFYSNSALANIPYNNGGGAVFTDGKGAYIVNCTFAGNSAPSGADVCFQGDSSGPKLFLLNNIFSSASSGSNNVVCGGGAVMDAGHNLSSDASPVLTNVTSLLNTKPVLGPLTNNGGSTATMALLPGSPAIGEGSSFGPLTDQRGVARPLGACDIGAFQATPVTQCALKLVSGRFQVSENGTNAVITVARLGGTDSLVGVDYSTSDGTAHAGTDYLSTSGTLWFSPGETNKVILVPIVNDSVGRDDRTVLLSLSAVTGGAVLGRSNAELTIQEDDSSFAFSASTYGVSQNGAAALITVCRYGSTAFTASVAYSTSNGTALAGENYLGTNGTLVFLPGQRQQAFVVGLVRTAPFKQDKTVQLALSAPTVPTTLVTPATATLTILGAGGRVLTNCNEADLQLALTAGGPVELAADGTFVLTRTLQVTNDSALDASGHNVIISGNDSVRAFSVAPGVQFTLKHLTVAHGLAERGAGLYNAGGSVSALDCTFVNNVALGSTNRTPAGFTASCAGGALYNDAGTVSLLDTRFLTNRATAKPSPDFETDGGSAEAGAIWSSGLILATNCLFQKNQSIGGDGGTVELYGAQGGNARAGAVANYGGSFLGSNCLFALNTATAGGAGGRGSPYADVVAAGGAIFNTGTLHLASCVFSSNVVSRALTVSGGAIHHEGGTLRFQNGTMLGNAATGDHVSGYPSIGHFGKGGALFSAGSATLIDSLLEDNLASGPMVHWVYGHNASYYQGCAGSGCGGALYNKALLLISRCALLNNVAMGAPGGWYYDSQGEGPTGAGSGFGGALYCETGQVQIVNSTIYANAALGGAGSDANPYAYPGGAGSGGAAEGGGVYSTNGWPQLTNCTLVGNLARGGSRGLGRQGFDVPTDGVAAGGGIVHAGGLAALQNSIVALNTPEDVRGKLSGNPNLIGVDPRLSPLSYNGGPTPTLALLPDSPAIDAASPVFGLDTDQRGVVRPFGSAPDIGAYEWNAGNFYTSFRLSALRQTNSQWRLAGAGPTNQVFHLQISSNLTHWVEVGTNVTGPYGLFEFEDKSQLSYPVRFYRATAPGTN